MRMYKQENHDLDSYDIIDNSPNSLKGEVSKLDMRILNIMRIAAAKDGMLAAYKARKKCYRLCKKDTNQSDYKEHVQALQLDNYPLEFKKAELGRSFVWWLLLGFFSIVLLPILGYCGYEIDDEMWLDIGILASVLCFVLLLIRLLQISDKIKKIGKH